MDASDPSGAQSAGAEAAASSPSPIGLLSGATAPLWAAILHAESLRRAGAAAPRGYLAGVADGAFARLGAAAFRVRAGLAAAGVDFEPLAQAEIAAAAHAGAQKAGDDVFSVFYASASGMLRGGAAALRRARRHGAPGGGLAVVADDASETAAEALRLVGAPILHPATPIEAAAACLAGFAKARETKDWVSVALPLELAEATTHHAAAIATLASEGAASWPQDQRTHGPAGARFGLVATGGGWAALDRALTLLGLDEAALAECGLAVYRIFATGPIEPAGLRAFADGMETLSVVETSDSQNSLTVAVRAAFYGRADAPHLAPLRVEPDALAAETLAVALARRFGAMRPALGDHGASLVAARDAALAARPPRERLVLGADAAEWIGAARFGAEDRRVVPLDGAALERGGIAAIQATVRAGAPATFVVKWAEPAPEERALREEDADALEARDIADPRSPTGLAARLLALGVEDVALLCDPARPIDRRHLSSAVKVRRGESVEAVEADLARAEGVAVIVDLRAYDGPEALRRFTLGPEASATAINPFICDGCGDCDRAGGAATLRTIATETGEARRLDSASSKIDAAQLPGACPAFIGASGARRKMRVTPSAPAAPAPQSAFVQRRAPWTIGFAGGADGARMARILAAAARREGHSVGLWIPSASAADGFSLSALCRIATDKGPGAGAGEHALMGPPALGEIDSLVSCADDAAIIPELFRSRFKANALKHLRPRELSARYFGVEAGAGLVALGAAFQSAQLQVSFEALVASIEAEAGQSGEEARRAFDLGRAVVADPAAAAAAAPERPLSLTAFIERRAARLVAYQDSALAARYRRALDVIHGAEKAVAPGAEALTRAAAEGFFTLLSRRDVYEVARLLSETTETAAEEAFEAAGDAAARPVVYLTSSLLAGRDESGAPRKAVFGSWIMPFLRVLKHGRALRGGMFDPLGWTALRRLERALIEQFERDVVTVARGLSAQRMPIAIDLMRLPLEIRGFGHVKERAAAAAAAKRAALWADFKAAPGL
ncbi:MAG: hypothetical protein MRY74_12200 [Neomegalonema sp.]|nr:hypothetical protein [Neomegalonema sp.]